MKFYLWALVLLLITLLGSCRKDFDFEPASGNLSFSRDTVFLDTVFSNISSSTYALKVYNRSNKNIRIPSIELGKAALSHYRLMVDGRAGYTFSNVELLAKDSLYIFVESTIDAAAEAQESTAFLYTDAINFGLGTQSQKVELVTLVKDAYFLYPKKGADGSREQVQLGGEWISGFALTANDPIHGNTLRWKSDKPYVIYGYAAIPKNQVLVVEAGAQIHFHDQSGIVVNSKAQVQVLGTLSKPVQFQGDRLEPKFAHQPGQWGALWFEPGSSGVLNNLSIRNATVGLRVDHAKLELNNLQIHQSAQYGLFAKSAQIYGTNVVASTAGQASVALTLGGEYHFIHATLANFSNQPNAIALRIDDGDGSPAQQVNKAIFSNSIIYSLAPRSLLLHAKAPSELFKTQFENTNIKIADSDNPVNQDFPYDFSNVNRYKQPFLHQGQTNLPRFLNPSVNRFELTDRAVDLIGKGAALPAQKVPMDLLGKDRSARPDLGAYQNVTQLED